MTNYNLNRGYYNSLVKVKPYNTNREKDKVSPAQALLDILNGSIIRSDKEAVRAARKIVNADKINTRIDRSEYLINTVKRLLLDEVDIGDFATKYGFADVVEQMKKDGKFCCYKKDINTTTMTFLALNDLVTDGIFIQKKMKNPNRTWKDSCGDMHYYYETVYERVK